jgi:hypothetical protein
LRARSTTWDFSGLQTQEPAKASLIAAVRRTRGGTIIDLTREMIELLLRKKAIKANASS